MIDPPLVVVSTTWAGVAAAIISVEDAGWPFAWGEDELAPGSVPAGAQPAIKPQTRNAVMIEPVGRLENESTRATGNTDFGMETSKWIMLVRATRRSVRRQP